MKYKKSLLIICLVICLFSIASVCASDVNETIVASEDQMVMESHAVDLLEVENQSDDELSASSGTFADLANEIAAADGELNLTRDYVFVKEDSNYQYGIDIYKKISINGNGHVIDGAYCAKVFYCYYPITLTNISFLNCYSDGDSILNLNGNGSSLDNCNFTNCNSCINWGGNNGNLDNCNFINCYFNANEANYGSIVYWNGDNGNIIRCNFINCNISNLDDSSCSVIDVNGLSCSLTECNFINCISFEIGDYNSYQNIISWSGDLGVVNKCNFTNCCCDYSCTLKWYGHNGSLINSNFDNCLSFCFNNEFDPYIAGAVSWMGENGILENCSFQNCFVKFNGTYDGFSGALLWLGEDGTLVNSSFISCHSYSFSKSSDSLGPGAVYWLGENGIIEECYFVNCWGSFNENNYSFSAVYSINSTKLLNNKFTNCSDEKVKIKTRLYLWVLKKGTVVIHVYGYDSAILGTYVSYSVNNGTIKTARTGAAAGAVVGNLKGKVTITAEFAGDDDYYASKDSFVFDFTDLSDEINNTNENEILYLQNDYQFPENLFADINISKSITIDGKGHTINSKEIDKLLYITADNVILKNIIFTNDNEFQDYLIQWDGNNGSLINCSFKNCDVNYLVKWQGNNGSLINCTFIDFNAGNGVVWCGDNGLLYNSNFTNNYFNGYNVNWTGNNGNIHDCNFNHPKNQETTGSVFWSGNNGTIYGSNFLNSYNSYCIYWNGENGNLHCCSFLNSLSDFSGKLIFWNGIGGKIYDTNFTNIKKLYNIIIWNATNGYLGNCKFKNCNLEDSAISWENNFGKVENCSFYKVSSDYGVGAINWRSDNGMLLNSNFINCSYNGEDVSWWGDNGEINNCNFLNYRYGNAVYWYGSNGSLKNSRFINYGRGQPVDWNGDFGVLYNCSFIKYSSVSMENIISWRGNYGLLSNSKFENYSVRSAFYWTGSNGTLFDCSIINSSSSNELILWEGEKGSIDNCHFINSSSINSRTIYWSGSEGLINKCNVFNSNKFSIDWDGASGKISDCNLLNNINWYGVNGSLYNSNLTNSHISWESKNAVISNCIFMNCFTSNPYRGGNIYLSGWNSTLNNCKFINCSVSVSDYSYGGGAIFWDSINGSIFNCSFINCSSDKSGGAIFVNKNVEIYNCNFNNCSAISGGAIRWEASYGKLSACNFVNCINTILWYENNGLLFDCSFINCSSTRSIVSWRGINGSLYNSSFLNCHVNESQSGIVIWDKDNGILFNCSFNNCSAASRQSGGAIYWIGNNGTMYGCNFINCYSENSAGAIYWYSINGTLFNSSFINCSSGISEHTIYWEVANGTVYDCIFMNLSSGAIKLANDNEKVINCSFTNVSEYSLLRFKFAIDLASDNCSILNCKFLNCALPLYCDGKNALLFGSSFLNCNSLRGYNVYWKKDNGKLYNCSFLNSTNKVILWQGYNGTLFNTSFVDCFNASSTIDWSVGAGTLYNCSFIRENLNNFNSSCLPIDIGKSGHGIYNCIVSNCISSITVNVSDVIAAGDDFIVEVMLFNGIKGNVTVRILDDEYSTNLNDGKATIRIPKLPRGTYNYTIEYAGDDRFNSLTLEKTVISKLKDSFIKLNVLNISFGQSIIISPLISPNATGNVGIYIDNVFKTNMSVGNGYILENLNAGNYSIRLVYSGDDYYESSENISAVNVAKIDNDFNVSASNLIAGEDIQITISFDNLTNSNVTIQVNNKSYTKKINGLDVGFVLSNLTAGKYKCVVNYSGDLNYLSNVKEYSFEVSPKTCDINVSSCDIFVDETANVYYNITKGASGVISVYVNDTFIKNVTVGSIIQLTDLSAGINNVKLVYNTDGFYEDCRGETRITVNKLTPTITVVDEVDAGHNVELIISFDNDASGYVSVKFNDKIYSGNLVDGKYSFLVSDLKSDNYECVISYGGDSRYKSLTVSKDITANLKVSEILLNINDIHYKEYVHLNPIIPSEATGSIIVYVDSVLYGTISAGDTLTLKDWNVGLHNIKVVYSGDEYYFANESSVAFNVLKTDLKVNISSLLINNEVFVNLTVDKEASGNIILNMGNELFNGTISNGNLCILVENVRCGNYDCNIIYSGDGNFNNLNKSYAISILPKVSEINISSQNCYCDENVVIEYNITPKTTGIITIYANEIFIKNVTVGDEIELENLKAGNHTIKVVYNSDGYFASCENVTQLEIYKLTPYYYIDDSGAGKNANISIVFDEDATGNVNVSFGYWILDENNNDVWEGNYNFTGQLINGEVSFTIPDLEGGWIEYIIKYSGDDRYDSLTESDYIWVSYKESPISIDIPEINWSDNVILKPALPKDATGNIHLILDNISLANISLGDSFQYKAIKGGKHYLTIEYSGDEYFTYNETTVEFYVNKLNSNFSIESIFDSEKFITVPITLNDDANGFITVNINSNIFSGDVINGSFNFTVTDLGAGVHNAIINYTGDDKYNDIYIAKEITVSLKNSNLDLNISNILKDENLLIKPILTENSTGTVSIYIDDEFKTTVNAESSYTLLKPTVGQHKIKLIYSGNTYFASAEKEFSFRVFTKYPIEAVDTQIVYGNDKKFQAKFYDEYGEILANKYVSFVVNGTEYPIRTNSEGIAVLDADLGVGEYNVTSISLLDESTTNKLLIFHSIQAESMIIEYGSDTRFKATFLDETASPLKNTRIVFNIDGKDTMVTTDVDGVAVLNTELTKGIHYITSINTITDENMTNKVVVVSEIDSIVTIQTNDINYNQKAIVKVNIDSAYLNANVTVKVTGDNGYEQVFTQKAAKTITKELSNLNASKYYVDVKYEDSDLLVIQKNTTFNVLKIDPSVTLSIDGETLTVNIFNATGNVVIKVNGESSEETLTDSKVINDLFNLKVGENFVEVYYKGDNNYNPLIKTDKYTLWNSINLDVDFAPEIISGEYVYVNVYNLAEDIENGTLTLYIDNVKVNQDSSLIEDAEEGNYGLIEFDSSSLAEGTHTWKITYTDISNYINVSKSGIFDVIVPPEPDTYRFSLITNKSIIYIPFDKITWNVKQLSVYDEYVGEYYDSPYINYTFSVFTLNGVEYTIIKSSIDVNFASLYVSFNPSEYKQYDGIYYKVQNGNIVDTIGVSEYENYSGALYRYVGIGQMTFAGNSEVVTYVIINGECYKVIGTLGSFQSFFYKAVMNTDYKILNGEFYTLDGDVIKDFPEDEYWDSYAVVNGTFYDIDGNIYTPHSVWSIGHPLISNNGQLDKVVYGNDLNNTYAVSAGQLCSVGDGDVGAPVKIDMTQPISEDEMSIPSLDNVSLEESVEIKLPSDATGTVTLTVNGNDYKFDVKNGVAKVELPQLSDGNYNYTITYSGDSKYSSFSNAGSMKVNNTKPAPEVVIPPLDKPSDDGSVTVSLPSDATGIVTLNINGKDYPFAVVNGQANLIIPNLNDGNYQYTITYSGDSKYASFISNGSLKVNKTVSPANNETNSTGNTTVVDKSKITASNVKVTYAAGSYYSIKVYGKDGKLANGVKVVIKVNGKTFKTLTTKNGIAKFKVTSVPGTYKMTITALGKSVTKTLTVKHLVTLKTVTVKKSAKKLVLTATLAKVNKKYLKNKKITFKFNGKKYTAKTNKKGVAKVTIKSSVLKKLKVAKKVTYQATYLKDTVKKTVKIKK